MSKNLFGKKPPEQAVVPMMQFQPPKPDKRTPVDTAVLPKGFDPIKDLAVGDRLRVKGPEYALAMWPSVDDVVVVNSVIVPEFRPSPWDSIIRPDFTTLFRNEKTGVVEEYAYDSRRFERVE